MSRHLRIPRKQYLLHVLGPCKQRSHACSATKWRCFVIAIEVWWKSSIRTEECVFVCLYFDNASLCIMYKTLIIFCLFLSDLLIIFRPESSAWHICGRRNKEISRSQCRWSNLKAADSRSWWHRQHSRKMGKVFPTGMYYSSSRFISSSGITQFCTILILKAISLQCKKRLFMLQWYSVLVKDIEH